MSMSGRLGDKVAIVTGGASGIGYAIASGFVREGARVCIADLATEACDAAAARIGPEAYGHALDVRRRDSIATLVEAVVARSGRIDILVNCAGVFGMQPLLRITEDEFDRVIGINLRGLLFTTQAIARRMLEQGTGGAIINISSEAGRRGAAGAVTYSASKAGVISVTQSTALELIGHGIRVNAIAPGAVDTPMWSEVRKCYGALMGIDPDPAIIAATPAGRLSTPQDYVGAAVFLASAESNYVVGQTFNVDGGMFMN